MKRGWYCLVTLRLGNWQFCETFSRKRWRCPGGPRVALRKVSRGDKHDSANELDALTAVGSVLFNLDAALTR
jgi:hypothetical protein